MYDSNGDVGNKKARKYLVSVVNYTSDWEVDSYVSCEVHAHMMPMTGASMVPLAEEEKGVCRICQHLAQQQASTQIIKHRAGSSGN